MREWNRAAFDELELEYLTRVAGEPVVLIHAGMFADWFDPLVEAPSLAEYTILSYHRIGLRGAAPRLERKVSRTRRRTVGHSCGTLGSSGRT